LTDIDDEAVAKQAEALAREGRFAEAEPLYRTAVRRAKEAHGKEHPVHGAALYDLSRVLSAQSKHAEAEEMLRRALAIFEEEPGIEQPPWGQTLHTLAGVLAAQDKFAEAEELLRAALAKQEKRLGDEHPSLGATLTNLAIALVQEQRLAEAEKIVLRALAIAEATHGEAHAETARILTILAQVQGSLGDDAAPATAKRALNAMVATHGEDHPLVQDVKPILEDIAAPSAELDGELEKAAAALDGRDPDAAIALLAPLVQRARRDGLLPLEASASGLLAQALFLKGNQREAVELAHRALAIAEDAGEEEASAHFRELVEFLERGGDTGLPDALHKTIEEAIATAQGGDVAGAVRALESSADEAHAAGKEGSEATVRIVLGQILRAASDHARADQHFRRALDIAERMGDEGAAAHVRGLLEKPS
jgi:tetratricopeptide (TPR) repeat protein